MSQYATVQEGGKLSAANSMLKKARSFRNDMKLKLRGSQATVQSNEKPKKSILQRNNSFNGGKSDDALNQKTDLERLDEEYKKIQKELDFVKRICSRGLKEQLSGSVTVVVEIVIDVMQLLQRTVMNQESSTLVSACNQLRQRVADFARWSDLMLLEGLDGKIDLHTANSHIDQLKVAVEELFNLAKDKLKNRKRVTSVQLSSNAVLRSPTTASRDDMGSVDLPLSLREKQLLKDTDKLTASAVLSKSADDILGLDADSDVVDGCSNNDEPPPKPPLPRSVLANLKSVMEDRPPTLPSKKRVSSGDLPCEIFNNSMSRLSLLTRQNVATYTGGISPAGSTNSNPVSIASSVEDILAECQEYTELTTRSSRQEFFMSECDSISSAGQLSHGIDRVRSGDFTDAFSPPLPEKKSHRSMIEDSGALQYSHDGSKCCFSERSQERVLYGTVVQHNTNSEVHTVRQDGYQFVSHSFSSHVGASCSRTFSKSFVPTIGLVQASCESSSCSSQEQTNMAPPLPPKLKHTTVSYMKMVIHGHTNQMCNDSGRHSAIDVPIQDFVLQDQLFQNRVKYRVSATGVEGIIDRFQPIETDMVPALPPKTAMHDVTMNSARDSLISSSSGTSDIPFTVIPTVHKVELHPVSQTAATVEVPAPPAVTASSSDTNKDADSAFVDSNTLEEVDVTDQLIFVKPGEDGPSVHGGFVDALIVNATAGGDLVYRETFLTTYRTFLTPYDLITKLLYRYNHFSKIADLQKKKTANSTFSLLIRVVDDLCTATDERILQTLMDLVYQLLCDGELMLARTMRKKVLEKYEHHLKRLQSSQQITLLSSFQLTTKVQSLLQFDAKTVAEQMTILDAVLFQKIELPEVLLWTREQSEESSPNLTRFTEHFNKMSYWCRSRILEQEDAREREQYFIKFIKVMKYLRRLNNFNSYLAVLSAVDSAPVRRLEWQKQNIEALKEYCRLIDSSSSFRAYRQVLAKAEPPCIPYIGLVLQDLTFVHIGNSDKLPDGQINFTKCWQLYNVLENMRRFKQCNYDFKRNEDVITYFNNFDSYISEESLWQISETIKPRGSYQRRMS